MSDYRDLKLKDDPRESAVEDWENLPEQRGGFAPPLQPGRYEFRLPPRAAMERAWDTMEVAVKKDGPKVQRVYIQFNSDCPLEVIGGVRHVGDQWQGRVNNAERDRAKRGDPPKFVSDMDWMLRDGLKHQGKPKGNLEYMQALNSHGGEAIVADNEWSAYCNPQKKRYISNGQGGTDEDPSGALGCGERYYTRDFPRDDDGSYYPSLVCSGRECGAVLRAFQNLNRFAPGNQEKQGVA